MSSVLYFRLAIQGWRRALISEDLWVLNDEDGSKSLVQLWEKVWNKKMQNYWRKKELASQHAEAVSPTAEEEVRIVDGKTRTSAEAATFRAGEEEVRIVDGKSKRSAPSRAKPPKPPKAPSIIGALFLCFWNLFIPATVVKTFADALQFASPQLLR